MNQAGRYSRSARKASRSEGAFIYLIVGIDPGINAAYAALDLNGKFIASGTFKGADPDRIVGEIAKNGIPSIIASDVNPAPSFVLKIAARFNVRTFTPFRVITDMEKRETAQGVESVHERDALCAAIKCFRMYANRLRQIELLETRLDKDRLKHLVIEGFSLTNAMLVLENKGSEPVQAKENRHEEKKEKDDELVALAEENINLKKALDAERKQTALLQAELEKVKSARYAERWRDSELRKLLEQNKKLSGMVRALRRRLGLK